MRTNARWKEAPNLIILFVKLFALVTLSSSWEDATIKNANLNRGKITSYDDELPYLNSYSKFRFVFVGFEQLVVSS
jgi:hypothetical protein